MMNELVTSNILEYHDSESEDRTPAWGTHQDKIIRQETLLKIKQMEPNLTKAVQKFAAYIPVQRRKEIKRPNLTLQPSEQ